jgi:hypothetical protein
MTRSHASSPPIVTILRPSQRARPTLTWAPPGPQQDLNLGIHLYIDGAPADALQLDTSVAGTHSLDYVVTDAAGLTATSTRTVIVTAPANDTPSSSGGRSDLVVSDHLARRQAAIVLFFGEPPWPRRSRKHSEPP